MRHFLNLTTCVINKLHIIEIIKKPSHYSIYMSNPSINGFILFSSGRVETTHNIIEICEKKSKPDYDAITDFIRTLNH